MKKQLLFCLVSLLTSSSACADWVVVHKGVSEEAENVITTKYKDGLIRVDIGVEGSTIIDQEHKWQAFLNHKAKNIVTTDALSVKSSIAIIGNVMGSRKGKESKLTPTGEMETIGDWECEVFEWEDGISKGKMWVAKDFPDYEEIGALMDKSNNWGKEIAILPESTKFKGMIIKSHTTSKKLGRTIVTTLISAKREEVDPSIFKLPEGYKEIKMPKMPGQK